MPASHKFKLTLLAAQKLTASKFKDSADEAASFTNLIEKLISYSLVRVAYLTIYGVEASQW